MPPAGEVRVDSTDALIVVDPQNDFLPGGSLAVSEGNRIFDPINRLLPKFALRIATRDWHPKDHAYFQERGGPWPYHCLAGTAGAEFSPALAREYLDLVVSKGTDPQTDGYSGFAGTNLAEVLHDRGVRRVFVCGLATDYCVKATALEARAHGFETFVVTDAIAAVNLAPSDEERAHAQLREGGVRAVAAPEIA